MAETTIKSTNLDFNAIKNNLKTFIAAKQEFADYNFEASGLSNILDVLAYNTHYNALIANFGLNESFLTTAQLRGSVVSLASSIGYDAYSKTASTATVNLRLDLSGVLNRPPTIALPSGTKFNTTFNQESYVFQTRETLTASDEDGIYNFKDTIGSADIKIYEGSVATKRFIVGAYEDNPVYVIPDLQMDTNTAIVTVKSSPSASAGVTYTNIKEATELNSLSTVYVLKEAPNGFYELSFSNGNVLGITPEAGNQIEVSYLRVAGPEANGATVFVPQTVVTVNSVDYDLNVVTSSPSAGGSEKEGIESIRRNAPYQYASQNRMVTAADYSALALREYGPFIDDIQTWGGQDNTEPDFGSVYMSINFKDNVEESTKKVVKDGIKALASDLSIVSFNVKFSDPSITYIETSLFFQFNQDLTTFTLGRTQDDVQAVVREYFNNNTGGFFESFRRSNLLAQVDDVSNAVLSSRCDVKLQRRITPILSTSSSYSTTFPVPIEAPNSERYSITSSTFRYAGVSASCILRNKLNSNVLQVVANNAAATVIVDDAGSYIPGTGVVNIVGFKPSAIDGGVSYIKLKAIPGNQSAVSPTLNNILEYDDGESFSRGILVESL